MALLDFSQDDPQQQQFQELLRRFPQLVGMTVQGQAPQTQPQMAPSQSAPMLQEIPVPPEFQTPQAQPQQPGLLSRLFGGGDKQPEDQPKQDIAGLLGQQPQDKNKWAMPLGLGLLNMSAGLAQPYRKGIDTPSWAQGMQGLGQGMTQGMMLQKAQQDQRLKDAQTMMALKKLYGQPEVVELGGVKFARDTASGKLTRIDKTEGKPTDFDKKFKLWQQIPGNENKTVLQYETEMAEAKGEGKPEKEQSFEKETFSEWLQTHPNGTRMQFEADKKRIAYEVKPEAAEKEQQIILAAEAERLGKPISALTNTEKASAITKHKQAVSGAQTAGKFEGFEGASKDMVKSVGDAILSGKQTIEQVRNTFGMPLQTAVMEYVSKRDPNYNFIQASANRKWYESPNTQRLIRRTESIVAPDGPVDEALRMAKEVKMPAGTKINELKGDLAVQFGNSRIQLLRMINDISAEEQQQIFGAIGGGEKFLELAKGLANPNMSMEQYTNSLKEIRHLIMTRQLANVRGTPEQEKWEAMADRFKIERPYLRPKQESSETKPKQATAGTSYQAKYEAAKTRITQNIPPGPERDRQMAELEQRKAKFLRGQ